MIADTPDMPGALANAGIRLRDKGDIAAAQEIFGGLIERFPHLASGWQELGVLRARQGEAEEALRLFRYAVQLAPDDFQTRRHLATHLLRLERFDEAIEALQRDGADEENARSEWQILRELIAFVREYPRQWALEMVGRFETSGRFLQPDAVGERILEAIRHRRRFALIRLGDGEARWLRFDPADEARYRNLYEENRRQILKVWFASDRAYALPSFRMACSRMAEVIERSDVIGIPSRARVALEYSICSASGIPGCVNILRWLSAKLATGGPGQFCAQDIHQDLHHAGFLRRLLELRTTFGVVTCHPELGYRLARSFGTRVVFTVLVPEELGFCQVVDGLTPIDGVSGITEPHFPNMYQRTIVKLQRLAPQAAVWLIGAGYLGKIYCDVVREAGSIALDLGSILDGWSGRVTRPYLKTIDRFRV